MKKTFLATLCLVSISFFANAEKVVIKNDSKYNISYGTNYAKALVSKSIPPTQFVIVDLPDNTESDLYIRRWSWSGAAKNIWTWGKRAYTAVAPSKENAADFAKEAYRFGGEDVYNRFSTAKTTVNPSLVSGDKIKVVLVTNFDEGTDTIQATIIDGLKTDYPGAIVDENVEPSSPPIDSSSLRKSQELATSLGIDEEKVIKLYNRLLRTASELVATHPEYEKEFEQLIQGPASEPSPEACELLQDFLFGESQK
ncbi:MAG: hypothetical protein Q8L85_00005 [Alphaproteobacteria bacterium]|nr:hypothetical protein [Alphaproteobacteria bacterium]